MAATKAICFGEPAQLGGCSFGLVGLSPTPDLHPLWYAYLFAVAGLALQGREARR
jgi:hypothetical protein